jgi:hypothetical protein
MVSARATSSASGRRPKNSAYKTKCTSQCSGRCENTKNNTRHTKIRAATVADQSAQHCTQRCIVCVFGPRHGGTERRVHMQLWSGVHGDRFGLVFSMFLVRIGHFCIGARSNRFGFGRRGRSGFGIRRGSWLLCTHATPSDGSARGVGRDKPVREGRQRGGKRDKQRMIKIAVPKRKSYGSEAWRKQKGRLQDQNARK